MDFGFFAILLGAAALLVLALHLISRVRERRARQQHEAQPLPIFFRLQPDAHAGNGNGNGGARTPPVAGGRLAEPVAASAPAPRTADGIALKPLSSRAEAARPDQGADEKTVVFQRFTDGPLQLLPGRLEVVEGDGQGRDIRFMRAWGEPPEVTFGRSRGPAHRHVQLSAPTVSRNHARMELEGERWKIVNLSATNPVVVNGQELVPHSARLLDEGDRIEMGEVIFRYRER
jgi:hypothetical protein